MTFGELKRLLKKAGCYYHHQGSRHEIWESPKTGKQFPVGRHDSKEVRDGTLRSIKNDAGLE
jgi:predicted RNA binding protein YcfA (HicA-like mRNA interferase family)